MKRHLLLPALLCVYAGAALAAGGEKVILLPFVNRTGVEAAPSEAAPVLALEISKKGYEVVRGDEVEGFLETERVRYLDSLPEGIRKKLLTRFGATGVVSGSLYTHLEGANPIVGLSARLVGEDGHVLWSAASGLSAADTQGLFALGRVGDAARLSEQAVKRLFAKFPAPGASARLSLAGKPLHLAGPWTYRAAYLPHEKVHRICILPFGNLTQAKEAPWVVAELLAAQLSASGRFEVVEPADFRAAAAAEMVRGFRDPDPDLLRKIAGRIGTTLFLKGTIYHFREGSPEGAAVSPQIELELSLVDVKTGKVVWASAHARKGSDYRGFLQTGEVTSAVALAGRMTAEIVSAAGKATLKSPPNGNGNGNGKGNGNATGSQAGDGVHAARILREDPKGSTPP